MQSQTEKNCYKCKYRQNVVGSAHSSCVYPIDTAKAAIMFMSGAKSLETTDKSFMIEGNSHGIQSGWFIWPIDFDPVWVEKCTGFVNKE